MSVGRTGKEQKRILVFFPFADKVIRQHLVGWIQSALEVINVQVLIRADVGATLTIFLIRAVVHFGATGQDTIAWDPAGQIPGLPVFSSRGRRSKSKDI